MPMYRKIGVSKLILRNFASWRSLVYLSNWQIVNLNYTVRPNDLGGVHRKWRNPNGLTEFMPHKLILYLLTMHWYRSCLVLEQEKFLCGHSMRFRHLLLLHQPLHQQQYLSTSQMLSSKQQKKTNRDCLPEYNPGAISFTIKNHLKLSK